MPDSRERSSCGSLLKAFDYDGQVAPEQIADADDYLSGTFLQGKLSKAEARTKELPLNLAIIDFP